MLVLMKKRSFATQVISVLLSLTITFVYLIPYELLAQGSIQIPIGTSVVLKTVTTLTPEQYKIGDTVNLAVVSDVIVNGKVVIKAGAMATGEINSSKVPGMVGSPAQIGLTLRSVRAVDGTSVLLTGSKYIEGKDNMATAIVVTILCCILGLMMKGGEALIPVGVQISATVTSSVSVTTF